MSMWSLATLSIEPSGKLNKAVSARIVSGSRQFTPQSIANTIWALAKFERHHEWKAIQALKRAILVKSNRMTLQGAVACLWSLSTLSRKPVGRIHISTLKRKRDTSESLAKVAMFEDEVINRLQKRVYELRDEWTQKEVSSILWSLRPPPCPSATILPELSESLEAFKDIKLSDVPTNEVKTEV